MFDDDSQFFYVIIFPLTALVAWIATFLYIFKAFCKWCSKHVKPHLDKFWIEKVRPHVMKFHENVIKPTYQRIVPKPVKFALVKLNDWLRPF